ncbi:nuclear factor NF-kappa-B p110 subunit-like isoform X3 [Hyposmocoma kahamanoa]|uniref:nuclear factor NF-kappa-B p110 subunit-like isoform X2 n=1 Tax=Hyposmocoma kahamanoa TaxID=1477025 RepID=UPI000E6D9C48|nr:nuclear factor NF-kappa-B p110 subunit-like isoform X2 [Hyposmocoma kahamanoa]XP_026322101.1 nuclear factor NF-kappa-B p110 subunit-like isoform X3 [Hyposmocoma kahamanoa]
MEPNLRIINEPQNARFRYRTERETSTHGSLRGVKPGRNGGKSYPTVELRNYTNKASIKCTLVQKDNTSEHPHSLHNEEQVNEDEPGSTVVPVDGHYTVGFAGLGVIHRPKKDISMWLYTRFQENGNDNVTDNALLERCREMARNIDLNVVRLKFSAHNYYTDEPICSPVYSRPILNLKSVATNQLVIQYHMPISSSARGGEDMVFLTSRISKSNIMVRMYELDENEDEIWSTNVHILPSHVHRQTAIVFNIPPYKDQNISGEVKVYMQLLRPNDGAVSEPRQFFYRPDLYAAYRKRTKLNNFGFYSKLSCYDDSVPSTRGGRKSRNGLGRIESLHNIPVQKSSLWGGTSTTDISTSVTSAVNISGNSQNNVSATQSGNSQISVFPQQNPINDYSDNIGQMILGSELTTWTATAGASKQANMLQNNMLQDAQGSQFGDLTTHSESQGLLQCRRTDPLLGSAGFDVNWQASAKTYPICNSFSQIVQVNQASQATSTIFDYTCVSSELTTNCQASQTAEPSGGYNATAFNANSTSSMLSSDLDTRAMVNQPFSYNEEDYDNILAPLSPDPDFDINNQNFLNYVTDFEGLRREDGGGTH